MKFFKKSPTKNVDILYFCFVNEEIGHELSLADMGEKCETQKPNQKALIDLKTDLEIIENECKLVAAAYLKS